MASLIATLCFGGAGFVILWMHVKAMERQALEEHRIRMAELDRQIKEALKPNPNRDKGGDPARVWDCMVKGHVCCAGSAYCLECRMLIG